MDSCSKMAGLLLLKEIQKDFNKNVVVSPLSFNAIMNMTAAGSIGPTLEQILEFLGSKNINDVNSKFSEFTDIATSRDEKDGPVLSFLNGAWVSKSYTLKDSYKQLVKKLYKAEARTMDVDKVEEVLEETNSWAKSASKGLITDVLKPKHIKPTTTLILGNALYFKGSWIEPFDRDSTTDRYFYLLNGDEIKAPFMTGCNRYSYKSFEDFQVVRIPYRAGNDTKRNFSMYIYLPNERDGLQSLLQRMNSDSRFLHKHSKLLRSFNLFDIFWIPKFKFTYCTEEAPEIMKEMGVTLPFDTDCEDLTEMVCLPKGRSLYVSTIIQKAFIEIDEQGTEAAAVTFESDDDLGCSMYSEYNPTRFVADHPFLFIIREENSGLVFFSGVVLNPLMNSTD